VSRGPLFFKLIKKNISLSVGRNAFSQSRAGLRGRELAPPARVLGLRVARCRVGKPGKLAFFVVLC
jgi:hypothetical protein